MTPSSRTLIARTPEETFHALLDGAARLRNGERDLVDEVAGLYAERTDVRHPLAPLGDTPLHRREELRELLAAGSTDPAGLRVTDVHVHRTDDPEVVIGEFTYRDDAGRVAPCIVVLRVRDGLVVESRDYLDHLGLARAGGVLGDLCARLTERG